VKLPVTMLVSGLPPLSVPAPLNWMYMPQVLLSPGSVSVLLFSCAPVMARKPVSVNVVAEVSVTVA